MILEYPQYESGMFRLHKSDFDIIALSVLKEYLPVAVDIAREVDILYLMKECLYLNIRSKNLSADHSVLGLIAFEDTTIPCYDLGFNKTTMNLLAGDVIIDLSLSGRFSLCRRRFTLAHEAAHWILHRSYHSPNKRSYEFRKPYIASLGSNVERKYKHLETDSDREEWQANSLAAALLMPKNAFIETAFETIHRYCGNNCDALNPQNTEMYNDIVISIASVYNVSIQAAEIRLLNLDILKE